MKKYYIQPAVQDNANRFELDLMVIVDSDKEKVLDDGYAKGRNDFEEEEGFDEEFNPEVTENIDNGLW